MVTIKPYLIRAAYQWALDSGQTPHLLVDATIGNVTVPRGHIEDGRIVLNIDPQATNNLLLGDDLIEFSARFSGEPFNVSIPISAVLGVYARENGEGISFPPDMVVGDEEEAEGETKAQISPGSKPNLKIIK